MNETLTRGLASRGLAGGGLRRRVERRARGLVLDRLARITDGGLRLVDDEGVAGFGARSPGAVTVEVRDPSFWTDVALGGSVGCGESYMMGHWSSDDLTGAMRLLLRNRAVLDGMEGGAARLSEPLRRLAHALSRNTRTGSRRNIAAHYDLGNDFFALFLDPTLSYSSAVFEHPGQSLEAASIAKIDRLCAMLDLQASDHLLEIGTGWGGFAIHAARQHGCRVTTTTISREQHTLATERVRAAGLQDRVTVLLQDYRALQGRYDKLVSVEMIEAVGHQYFDTYFAKCGSLLAPHGRMALQAITIADGRYADARDSVDFIKRYIFPGCCIPSVGAITASVARASDLVLVGLDDIGEHYATTLRLWRERFLANLPAVRALGLSDVFVRMWEFYLAYCEAGFAERALGDAQMLLAKPGARPRGGRWIA